MKKVVVGAVALVVVAGLAFDGSDGVSAPASPITSAGGGHGASSVSVAASFSAGSEASLVPPECRVKPTLMQRGTMLATKAGSAVHALGEPIPPDTQQRFVTAVNGSWWTLGYWWGAFGRAVNGDPILDPVLPAVDCGGGVVGSCVDAATAQAPAPAGSGVELVRAAAARVWPADEVTVAVAIAGAESSYNPDPPNPPVVNGSTMRGLWQINEKAHPDLMGMGDWRDPDVNARMAYQVWLQAGRSWTPWSTYNSGSYRKFLEESASVSTAALSTRSDAPQDPESDIPVGTMTATIQPGCANPSAVIGSWNVAHWNSGGNVLDGVLELTSKASIFGLQEVDDADRTRIKRALPPGWRITDGWSSTPIVWDGNRYSYLGQEQKVVLNRTRAELGSDGYTIPQKTMNVVQLVDGSGVRFAQVNFHLPPSTGGEISKDAPRKPRRMAAYRLEKSRVIAKVQELRAQGFSVAASCDCNRSDDLDGTFAAAGLVPSGNEATHGDRTLDFVYVAGMVPSGEEVLSRGYGSDHDAVLATFTADQPAPVTSDEPGNNIRAVISNGKTYQVPIPAGPQGVAISYALDQLGKPYVWASTGPNSFDCSGLVSAAYKQAGVTVFPQTEVMARQEPRATGADQPGDLWGHPGHVQMYLGVIDGKPTVVEAANPRDDIRIDQSGWMRPTWKLRPTAGSA